LTVSILNDFPKKRISVGALITNAEGKVLIVKPNYREGWLLPGGVVDVNESPAQALSREITEELDITIPVGELLCIDYTSADSKFDEGINLIFSCGSLSDQLLHSITLCEKELIEMKFCSVEIAQRLLVTSLAKRVGLLSKGLSGYFENGNQI
jgi:8-oxo-dGTP pyrophosphatase MutT (NUDIX family)